MWLTGLVAPRHVGSSQTRVRTRVPCIGRQTLNHCATGEAQLHTFKALPFSLRSKLHSLLLNGTVANGRCGRLSTRQGSSDRHGSATCSRSLCHVLFTRHNQTHSVLDFLSHGFYRGIAICPNEAPLSKFALSLWFFPVSLPGIFSLSTVSGA